MRIVVLAALLLAACGEATPTEKAGFASAKIELPAEAAVLPAGAGADLVAAKCTACHSLDMITTQPKMPAEKWAATVKKMRDVYRAPVAPSEDAQLAVALAEIQETRSP